MSSRARANPRGGPPRGGPSRGGPPGDRGGAPSRGGPPSDYGGGRGGRGGGFPDRGRGGGGFPDRGRGRGGFRGGPRGGDGGPVIYTSNSTGPARPDQRTDSARLTSLLQRLKTVGRTASMPVRQEFGTAGRAAVVRTNYLAINPPKTPILEYLAQITPKPEHKRIRARVFELLLEVPLLAPFKNQLAPDGGERLYAAVRLPVAEGQAIDIPIVYEDPDDESVAKRKQPKTYVVRLSFGCEHDPEPLRRYLEGDPELRDYDFAPALAAYNVILSQAPLKAGGFRIGNKSSRENKYFFKGLGEQSLGGGVVGLQGFFLSARPVYGALMANVNVATMAFYTTGPLAQHLDAFRRDCPGGNPDAFVSGLRIKTTHTGFTRTVRKLTKQPANKYMFDCEGTQMSVADYFKIKCDVKLKNPAGECVDVGKPGRPVVIPIELCWIIDGQSYRGTLTGQQTSGMLQIACRPPATNARQIMDQGVSRLGLDGSGSVANGFGITFGRELATVPSRILPQPKINYANNTPARINEKASWNLQNVKFAKPGAPVKEWGVMVITEYNGQRAFESPTDPNFRNLTDMFVNSMKQYGLSIGPPSLAASAVLVARDQSDRLRRNSMAKISAALGARRPQFLLILLANEDPFIYGGIKRLFDVDLGVHTICAQTSKILKEQGQAQYLANLSLKLNAKMGGTNHVLQPQALALLNLVPTMIVGIDVTHPSPNSEFGAPSIAAVVASVDKTYAQLPAGLRLQKGTKEMIFTELTEMMVERLALFRTRNGNQLPQRIIVFRDGVSEGQFKLVLGEELPAMRAAFAKMGQSYTPKLSIIVCAKRHQTRFYPTEQEVGGDEAGNTRPGTVVDVGVTSTFGQDFFLQAHHALQGTAKPTHYYPIYDELHWKADELQAIINALSYNFPRASKAISLVTPAYCADLACERARCYLREYLDGKDSDNQSVATQTSDAVRDHAFERAKRDWGRGVHDRLKDTMFYL